MRSSRGGRFAYAEKLTDRKKKDSEAEERFRETLLLWLSFWRDVLLCAAGSDAPLTNVDYSGAVVALASKLTLPEVRKLVSDIEGGIDKLERNVNARLLAEVDKIAYVRFASVYRDFADVGELIEEARVVKDVPMTGPEQGKLFTEE